MGIGSVLSLRIDQRLSCVNRISWRHACICVWCYSTVYKALVGVWTRKKGVTEIAPRFLNLRYTLLLGYDIVNSFQGEGLLKVLWALPCPCFLITRNPTLTLLDCPNREPPPSPLRRTRRAGWKHIYTVHVQLAILYLSSFRALTLTGFPHVASGVWLAILSCARARTYRASILSWLLKCR